MASASTACSNWAVTLFFLPWAALGAVLGLAVNRLSLRLERAELSGMEAEMAEMGIVLRARRWRDFFLPAAAALLFGLLAYKLGFGPVLGAASVGTLILLQILVVDFEYRLILAWVVLPACVLALAVAILDPSALGVKDWKIDLLCGGLATLFFAFLYYLPLWVMKKEALGFGDVQLGLFIGLFLNTAAAAAIIYGILGAGLISLVLLVLRIKKRGDYIPYGPFLCLGAIAALLLRS